MLGTESTQATFNFLAPGWSPLGFSAPWYFGPELVVSVSYYLCCLGASLATLLLLHFTKLASSRVRSIIVVVILLAAVVGLPVRSLISETSFLRINGGTSPLRSSDGSLAVEYQPASETTIATRELQFTDYRLQKTISHRFPSTVKPLWLLGRTAVILADQPPWGDRMTLLRWEVNTGIVTTLLSFPTRRDALYQSGYGESRYDDFFASLSPNGQYGLIALPPKLNDDSGRVDIWGVDLQQHEAAMLIPNVSSFPLLNVSWNGTTAILSNRGDPLTIAFPSRTIGRIHISLPREDH